MTIITQPYTFSDAKVKFNAVLKDIKNMRTQRDVKQDQRLQERIHSKGLHLPMFIGKTKTRDQFILIFGHRRHDVLEEAGYGDKNPLIDCIIVAPSDDPDRPLTNEEIRDLRLDDEFFWLNVTDYDTLMAVAQKTEDELAKGKNISQIAKEDFGKDESWVRKIRNAFRIVPIHNALKDGLISLHDSFNLLNIDEEAIKTLIEQRDTLTSREFADACKKARNGVSEASASESVKPSEDDPRTALINTVPEDLRERFTKDTKDFNIRDIERTIKLIENGVVMHDAIRTVKLSETSQGTEEDALTVHDGDGGKEEALLSPETSGIVGQTLGIEEKGTEDEPPEEEEPEEKAKDEDKKKDKPSPETKTKDPYPIVAKVVRQFEAVKKLSEGDLPKQMGNLPTEKQNTMIRTSRRTHENWLCYTARLRSATNGESYEMGKLISIRPAVVELTVKDIITAKEIENAKSTLAEMKKTIDENLNLLAKRGG